MKGSIFRPFFWLEKIFVLSKSFILCVLNLLGNLMFNVKNFFIGLILATIWTGAYADNQGVYKVELVVFTQPKGANASEAWLDAWDLSPKNIDSLLVSKTSILGLSSTPTFDNYLNTNIRRVGSAGNDFYSMNKHLQKNGRRVLLHRPFILNIKSTPTTLAFEAGVRKAGIPELLGTFNISVGKYFHFQTKAIFNDLSGINLVESNNSENTNGAYKSSLLFETRKMRSGELHYLDNPFFGIIVRIDKLEQ